ncbi:MAG TPA: FGGY family carbohydrate kinase [Thermoanaerobaculia bacterium]|jgi:glycerol kinase|nr:FGGY family carbohydrate kinase [Thermoanaerobaculia bacterium]
MLIAAVDQGSSSTKGALLDESGAVHARAEAAVGVRRDGGSVTHDPEELFDSVRRVLLELAALARPARPDAMALACQRSTCLLWERDSARPLTPALSWQDLSGRERAQALEPYAPEIARRTGLRLSPYYAGAKLGLLLERDADARRRAERGEVVAGTLDAFLVHRLTGRPSTEPGHAGRTLLYDLDEDRWDDDLCKSFGVPRAALPELLPSAGERGALRGEPWRGTPLEGVPLVALLGDQQAALVGNQGRAPSADGERVAVVHFGTGAFALVETGAAPLRHNGLLAAVAWSRRGAGSAHDVPPERRFQLEGSVNSAGSAVDWALRLRGAGAATDPAAVLTRIGEADLDPERLPDFLPGFVGVGAPWWLPHAGATFSSLALTHDADDLLRAVLAGVAHRVVDCLQAFVDAGVPPSVVRASGRLAWLPALAGLVADLSGLPVEVVAEEEAGLRGAARLAALALGAGESVLAAPPPLRARREPRWPESRRVRVRARWRAFVDAAAALPAPAAPGQ